MSKHAISDVWRMRMKALPWLVAAVLSYAFVIFGSHHGPSAVKWLAFLAPAIVFAFGLLVGMVVRAFDKRADNQELRAASDRTPKPPLMDFQ